MEHKDKKIKLDLDFLGEGAPEKSEKKKPESKNSGSTVSSSANDAPISDSAKWLGVFGLIVFISLIAWGAMSGNSSNTDITGTTNPPVLLTGTSYNQTDTTATQTTLPPPVPKTDNEICKDNYGVQSYSTGEKNSDGGQICDCNHDGYTWNDSRTKCVAAPVVKTGLQICQDRNGYNATYDSANNTCGCADGYSLGVTSQQCVGLIVARNQACAAKFPGTSWLKNDLADGHPICDCVAGYYWNNGMTACYSLTSLNQSCVNSFGTGSFSTTENGKRVCDCEYGYAFNPQRTSCVSVYLINQICERDVGRNSVYSGSSTNGKYNCTAAY